MSRQDAKPPGSPATTLHRACRLFVEAELAVDAEVALSPAQAHQLASVLRQAPGDVLRLFNGRDGEWLATIESLTRKAAVARAGERLQPQPVEAEISLCFAPIKQSRLDWLVEKATELGAGRLVPVITRRTQVPRINRDRLRAIAIEAAEQCERLTVPDIDPAVPLERFLVGWPAGRPLVTCIERADAPLLRAAVPPPPFGILIGPEGGFAPEEVAALLERVDVKPVSLGPRILRAETAGLAALAMCLGAA
ncbi:16S rRNA (uracil(1498)-N(3))-methyltransferase [Desertibaculum subflavum]|uniref:16S rRNA (uracil(1498)-N(3))-methyltransferase n=1 Tax=Desertibaculum subflavum TaxID=2268458 RepID=UPI000E664047